MYSFGYRRAARSSMVDEFTQAPRSPSPRKIPFTRHSQRFRMKARMKTRMKSEKWQHRSRRLTRSDVDQVEPVWERATWGSRKLLREPSTGATGAPSGTVRAPLRGNSRIGYGVVCSCVVCLCLARGSPNPKLRVTTLVTFNTFGCPWFTRSIEFLALLFCHVLELSFGALYCKVLLS